MVLQPSAHNQLTAHRTAAKESRALMRATIADIQEIIKHSRKVIDDSREAMRRVDDLLPTKMRGTSRDLAEADDGHGISPADRG